MSAHAYDVVLCGNTELISLFTIHRLATSATDCSVVKSWISNMFRGFRTTYHIKCPLKSAPSNERHFRNLTFK